MLQKRKLAGGKVRVTFQMPALEGVTHLTLVGDFNNWDTTATPLTCAADGSWSTALTLESGRDYQFRYLANGEVWHNDWAADAYVPNQFGGENSVVSLPVAPLPEGKSPVASTKTKTTRSRKKIN